MLLYICTHLSPSWDECLMSMRQWYEDVCSSQKTHTRRRRRSKTWIPIRCLHFTYLFDLELCLNRSESVECYVICIFYLSFHVEACILFKRGNLEDHAWKVVWIQNKQRGKYDGIYLFTLELWFSDLSWNKFLDLLNSWHFWSKYLHF